VPEPPLVETLRRWDPERIGGYTLLGRLGAGAMGRVYLGRSAAGRLVAVKTIKIELADEPEFRTRFAQEVAAARRVSGAFTAPVVAADPEADMPWLATAYVPAPSLSTLVRACGPLSVPAVRWLAAGCAEALESIHNAGLVHRDLKPSNVLVSPDGPRVIDFGVARAAERIQLTVTRGAVGTPAYMAPEQARDTRQATVASDVFSLGATMLFAATGHAPYQGDTVMDVLVQLGTEPPDLTGLPEELADIVAACLERDPRKRPTSAAVLAHLAQDVSPGVGDRALGPATLSSQALALIAEYRRDPGSSAQRTSEADADQTFGSQPAWTGSHVSGAGRRVPPRPAGSRRERGSGTRTDARRGRRVLLGLGSVVAAVALIASGVAIGAAVDGSRSGSQPPGSSSSSKRSPTGQTSTPASGVQDSRQQGSVPPDQGPPPGQGPPGFGLFPPSASADAARGTSKPAIWISQTYGDGYTVFVVLGRGWPPGMPVTIALNRRASPIHPIADRAGTFFYAINQGHEYFPGRLPPGDYSVVVTGASGFRTEIGFTVNHL